MSGKYVNQNETNNEVKEYINQLKMKNEYIWLLR